MKGDRLSRLAPWHVLLLAFTLVLSACASGPGLAPGTAAPPQETLYTRSERFVVVAVANPLQRLPARAATSLPGYGGPPRYTQGEQAARQLQAIARRHQLREAAAWPIPVLGVHCVVFEIAPEATRDQVLAALAADEQVQLAQPLQDFELLAEPADGVRYDDPYLPLQQGFLAMELARAHRYSRGRGVHIAVVDTGAQLDHPDLRGSALRIENLVDSATTPDLAERHGTEVLGLIAAAGNNGRGIVGVAPQARLSLYRACWAVAGGRARCNSFTLARALSAVLSSDARIVNLSLGGPPDPLLALLLEQLIRQGRTVVAAMPPDGQRRGFPAGIAGVLVVAASGQPLPDGALVLQAPGEDVLTLQPGGGYDFASGSSLAAAQVSGLAALLLARQPDLSSATIERLLRASNVGGPAGSEATIGQLIMRGDLTAGARLARQ